MAQAAQSKDNEMAQLFIASLLFLWVIISMGPLALLAALLSTAILLMIGANAAIAASAAIVAALCGMAVHHDLLAWVSVPVSESWRFYGAAFPGGLPSLLLEAGSFERGMEVIGKSVLYWFKTPMIWAQNAPLGIFAGSAGYAAFEAWRGGPLGLLKRRRYKNITHKSVGALQAALGNGKDADTKDGTVIGTDSYARAVTLSDKMANQHTLVLGTTGAGKTVTVCNIVESAVNRQLPVIYIDGKGDYALAKRIETYAQSHGRKAHIFSMKDGSIAYNPLAVGGFTSKKDRIIELREWTEEHYKKLAEGYLQTVFKIMEQCGIACNLVSLSQHLDFKRLKALIREHEAHLPDAQALMDELLGQQEASEHISSVIAEIRNFTASEIGALFKIEEGKETLTLQDILEKGEIAYFCLPALEFPSMAQTLGRLIINDLKATMAQQLTTGGPKKLYAIFDEFSVFAGEQVLNVINMGRSAGIHAVLSTQSLSDIASGRKENADHFINQVVGNCNNFILHRQNSADDAEKLASIIGTTNQLEYTAQVSQAGPTHMGTVRRTRGFIAHPDEIKALQTGEAFFFTKERNRISKMKARMSRI
ncbi:MAG: DUF853 family protein [Rhodospirillales bacterium]|nr:DUF853 family protein [Rhodospirillales bacterium]